MEFTLKCNDKNIYITYIFFSKYIANELALLTELLIFIYQSEYLYTLGYTSSLSNYTNSSVFHYMNISSCLYFIFIIY